MSPRAAQSLATTNGAIAATDRLGVRKTYKLYIGGEFPRTESGRAYEVFGARGDLLANACRGTRKDIRDAVRAARVVVAEYVDVAHAFVDGNETGMVNAVLDQLARQLRASEFAAS